MPCPRFRFDLINSTGLHGATGTIRALGPRGILLNSHPFQQEASCLTGSYYGIWDYTYKKKYSPVPITGYLEPLGCCKDCLETEEDSHDVSGTRAQEYVNQGQTRDSLLVFAEKVGV